jgi:hypothetical protein
MLNQYSEERLSDVANMTDYKKMKSVLKAQHGVDLGNPNHGEGGGNYRVHHDAKFVDKKNMGKSLHGDGRPLKTVHKKGSKNNQTTKSGSGDVVQMIKDSGRVNKSEEGKRRRKAEMRDNLEAKRVRRAEPFGRKADGMKGKKRTFEEFMMISNYGNESPFV